MFGMTAMLELWLGFLASRMLPVTQTTAKGAEDRQSSSR
jgi:hypothetical protein